MRGTTNMRTSLGHEFDDGLRLIVVQTYTVELYRTAVGEQSLSFQALSSHSIGAPCFAASKIRDAYVFIAQNYEVGDEICLFG